MKPLQPYDLAYLRDSVRESRVVQVISHPYHETFGHPRVKVRLVPGEPTTISDFYVSLLSRPVLSRRYLHVARVVPRPDCERFTFPDDILRYDGAATFERSDETSAKLGTLAVPAESGIAIFRLSRRIRHDWTAARWATFGMEVRPVYTRDLKSKLDDCPIVWRFDPSA